MPERSAPLDQSVVRALIEQGRVKCLCGRTATGTTDDGEPECDDLGCHAAQVVNRLRTALERIYALPCQYPDDPDAEGKLAASFVQAQVIAGQALNA